MTALGTRSALMLAAIAVVGLGAAADADGSRTETKTYVMSPMHVVFVADEAAPVGVGGARFAILAGESRVSIAIADAAAPLLDVEGWAVFRQDAPIVVQVNFCNTVTMNIPSGATTLRLFVDDFVFESGGDSACLGDHGATTGTITARFT